MTQNSELPDTVWIGYMVDGEVTWTFDQDIAERYNLSKKYTRNPPEPSAREKKLELALTRISKQTNGTNNEWYREFATKALEVNNDGN